MLEYRCPKYPSRNAGEHYLGLRAISYSDSPGEMFVLPVPALRKLIGPRNSGETLVFTPPEKSPKRSSVVLLEKVSAE